MATCSFHLIWELVSLNFFSILNVCAYIDIYIWEGGHSVLCFAKGEFTKIFLFLSFGPFCFKLVRLLL